MAKKLKSSLVYLDYASATPLAPVVQKAMVKAELNWGNPSSVHQVGQLAQVALASARRQVAKILAIKPEEVIFTSSGTESDNLALLGVAKTQPAGQIIVSAIEHPAVMAVTEYLTKLGWEVVCLPVNEFGLISAKDLAVKLTDKTRLVSVALANGEIGTIQPIREISQIIKKWRLQHNTSWPVLHSDVCAATGYLNIQPHALGVDLMSFSAQKIYGPKGVAVLYKRADLELEPLIYGGGQERGLRSGTESVVLAIGMATALTLVVKQQKKEVVRLSKLRDWLISEILRLIPNSRLNGDSKQRLPNNINISFRGVDSEQLVYALDRQGVSVSTGSACSATKNEISPVLKAIGSPAEWGNIRVTLGRETSKKELDFTITALIASVEAVRSS